MDGVGLQAIALEAIPKALVYAAVILSVGSAGARFLAARVLATSPATEPAHPTSRVDGVSLSTDDVDGRLARIGGVAALLLVLALALRAWAHTAVSFSIGESLSWGNLSLIAWESQWGEAWKLQMAGGLTLLVVAWGTASIAGSFAWIVTGLASLAVCFLVPLLGHAAGEPVRVLVHGSHIAGAGAWIGTLIVMAVALRGPARDAMLRAFAPVAFAGSAIIIASGLVAAWWYVGSPLNLLHSPYGWVLVVKLLLVADVGTLGFLNWRRFHGDVRARGRARTPAGAPDLFVYLEVGMALAVILVTAILTELEHP